MKKLIAVLILSMSGMMHAIVVDKINIADGEIKLFSQGVEHKISQQDYAHGMKEAGLRDNPYRWISILVEGKAYTFSQPTATWTCNRLKVC